MKKKFLLTLTVFMAVADSLLVGCVSAEENNNTEQAAAAVYVDGVAVPESLVAPRMSTGNVMYSTMSDAEKEAKNKELRASVIDMLAVEQAYLNDAEKNGIRLEGKVEEDADIRYENMIASVENYVKKSYPGLEGRELDETVDSMLKATGATRETYRLMAERAALLDAYERYLLSGMEQPSEEAISDYYETLYDEQKTKYDTDENAFEADMLNGKIVVYRPVPLKMIQKAEYLFEDTAIGIIRSTKMYNTELADEMTEDQYRILDETFVPMYDSLIKGEVSFDEVLANGHTGLANRCNYFNEASTRFPEDYYSRAAEFEEPGEISSYYRITNGYAILHYLGELPAADCIPVDDVKEEIAAAITSERSEAFVLEKKAEVLSKAVITYPERNE